MSINNPQINSFRSNFLLDTVSARQANTDWIDLIQNPGTYGWWAGGYIPNVQQSTVDRIDFSNDSPSAAVQRGTLSIGRNGTVGTGNSNYGWISLGGNGSTLQRIDFSNDLANASQRGLFNLGTQDAGGTGNQSYGWIGGGGNAGGPTIYSVVQRIDYSNDSPTSASPRGPLSIETFSVAATGNVNYGWWGGGTTPGSAGGSISNVVRIDFANDSPTSASPRSFLSITTRNSVATSTVNYGWWWGGNAPAAVTNITRLDFSNDTATTSARGFGIAARQNHAGTGNSGYGWVGGTSPVVSSVERLDFSNDTVNATTRGPLSQAKFAMSAVSNYVKPLIVPRSATSLYPGVGTTAIGNGSFGWNIGGAAPATTSAVNRIDFANDSPTTASARGQLPSAIQLSAAVANANYGWNTGGTSPPSSSQVSRIDFANDLLTAFIRGSLSSIRLQHSATGNANYGWLIGGSTPSPSSAIDRLDYANDSPASGSPRGPMRTTTLQTAATGNKDYGWILGGPSSAVDRIDYSNDSPTGTSIRGPLSAARYRHSGSGNANYGYVAGGAPAAAATSTTERIDFANDSPTSGSPRGLLVQARFDTASSSNANYGWFTGGSVPASPFLVSTVDRLDFSNDTAAATTRGPMNTVRYEHAAVSNYVKDRFPITLGDRGNYGFLFGGNSYGWVMGGVDSGLSQTSTIDRIDFSNDSPTSPSIRGNLLTASDSGVATGNANYGWLAGGTGPVSSVRRVDYSNDSPASSSTRGTLSTSKSQISGTGNANYGWIDGGNLSSKVDRIDFSNDLAVASIRGIQTDFYDRAATANTNYGWFIGGRGPEISTIDRLDFSNDLIRANIRGPLDSARYMLSATSNSNYGWVAGGTRNLQPDTSQISRIDFANDSPASASPRGPLLFARSTLAASGNQNYGWFIGGNFGSSPSKYTYVERVDYSNDSPTSASPRGPLSIGRNRLGSTSNYVKTDAVRIIGTGTSSLNSGTTLALNINLGIPQYAKTVNPVGTGVGTYGWIISGYLLPAPASQSTISRIDFNNDTAVASVRGPLPVSTYGISGVSNANYGWSAGGAVSLSTIYRIDYSNDSPTSASQKSNLPTPLRDSGNVSNANYGWFGAGNGPTILSSVSRLDFSNDLVDPSIRASLSTTRYILTAAGNANYGWFAGGSLAYFATPGNSLTSVERIDFNNDSPASSSPRGNLTVARAGLSASSNASYGWFSGGQTTQGTNISSVERIDFANDSPSSASPRGPLSSARYLLAAAGNSNYGWFAGGAISSGPTAYSTVDRIDYSNDSPTAASPRGTLNTTLWWMGSTSNYVK